ncbi:MAG: hypothetical protein R3288_16260 [Woeseiaceae bacterium]|nr:hypothetical protein [Woeseiaceae bacterium]
MHSIRQIAICTVLALMSLHGCSRDDAPTTTDTADVAADTVAAAELPELEIDASSFRCLDDMTAVRHFFVDNLLGDLDATIAVAESTDGGVYPPGSVLQLVPTEVMVKHRPGWNAATRDWEFFELDVTAEGSSIRNRGFVDVVNRFGGNCFACHVKAEPKYDLVCERDHGCDDIPITREQIAAIQAADPRCAAEPAAGVSLESAATTVARQ